jgi:hypothetical protein
MWIAEIAERAIMAAMAGLDVTMRASRVDNEPDAETERKEFPSMVIQASGGNKVGTESKNDEVPVTITITTHYNDDPKRTVLAGLEDQFRKILDAKIATSTVKTSFDSVASTASETRYFKGLTNVEGGPVEIMDKEQSIRTTFILHVCGA